MTPQHLYLEGRRPRRLVATRDIKRIGTFVPVGTEAAGPPIEFHVTCVPEAGEAAGPPTNTALEERQYQGGDYQAIIRERS